MLASCLIFVGKCPAITSLLPRVSRCPLTLRVDLVGRLVKFHRSRMDLIREKGAIEPCSTVTDILVHVIHSDTSFRYVSDDDR